MSSTPRRPTTSTPVVGGRNRFNELLLDMHYYAMVQNVVVRNVCVKRNDEDSSVALRAASRADAGLLHVERDVQQVSKRKISRLLCESIGKYERL